MSDFSRFVDDGDAAVYEFAQACEEMKDAKFIMAESKISELLMIVATSSKLQRVVATAANGFDFPAALKNARIRTGKRYSLLPPVGRRELIAFAMHLLYAFDVRAISLPDFLEEFYFSTNGVNFSFSLFVRSIILPLKDSVEAELRAETEGPASMPNAPTDEEPAEASADAPETAYLPDSAAKDLTARLSKICAEASNADLTADARSDLFSLANTLAAAVAERNTGLMRTLMRGLLGVVRSGGYTPTIAEKVSELDETFRHFGI